MACDCKAHAHAQRQRTVGDVSPYSRFVWPSSCRHPGSGQNLPLTDSPACLNAGACKQMQIYRAAKFKTEHQLGQRKQSVGIGGAAACSVRPAKPDNRADTFAQRHATGRFVDAL